MRVNPYDTNSGVLTAEHTGKNFMMDFPPPENLEKIPGVSSVETFLSRNLFVVVESEEEVRNLNHDFVTMKTLELGEGITVTALGKHYDFVSRSFYPKFGIDEDPVTISAYCIPYWAERLGSQLWLVRNFHTGADWCNGN